MYKICSKALSKGDKKIIINLDRETGDERLVRNVLCAFGDINGEVVSLPKSTNVGFHSLIETHAGHHFHYYNTNAGKTKKVFTRKKAEEEGLSPNDYVWILDFGWILHGEKESHHTNGMEFSFHFHDALCEDLTLTMLVFYEDEDINPYEFGWLWQRLDKITGRSGDNTVEKMCAHLAGRG